MTTTDENRRRAAKAFVERWTYRRGSEKGEDQQFWNDLLRSVLGVEDVESRIRYQVPVPMGGSPSPATARTTKFLDAWIPETRVLIEHKSRGVRELEISVRAGRIVGELYDALLKRYASPCPGEGLTRSHGGTERGEVSPGALSALNRLCVRLVFCLYAEDAGVFPKDCLRRLVEASEKAHVHCVIVGFHAEGGGGRGATALPATDSVGRPALCPPQKTLFAPASCAARNINGYLLDAPNVFVENRTQPLCDVPPMDFGNMPNDGGYFLLSPDERNEVLAQEPSLASVIRPFVGAAEFINRKTRYCFWLRGATPSFMRASPILRNRIESVRSLRLSSTAEATRRKADVPHLFFYISHPDAP